MPVTASVMAWARNASGYDQRFVAKKLGVALDLVAGWETGDELPTVVQLRKLCALYRRPLAVFLMPEPPGNKFQTMRDYRHLSGVAPLVESPKLLLEIRRAHERRELALELLEDLEEVPPPFPLSASMQEDPELVAVRIRAFLDVPLERQWSWTDPTDAFRNWRSAFENKGILVFQAEKVLDREMLAFSIAETPLPVVVVNGDDYERRKIFSLFHELCHIALRSDGLCVYDQLQDRPPQTPPEYRPVEVFCNAVAGAVLAPRFALEREAVVIEHQIQQETTWSDEDLAWLSSRYSMSEEAILRRLLILGRTQEAFYQRMREVYAERVREYLQKKKQELRDRKRKTGKSFGPTPAAIVVKTSGPRFVNIVLDSYNSEKISLADVSEFLGLRVKHLPKLRKMSSTRVFSSGEY